MGKHIEKTHEHPLKIVKNIQKHSETRMTTTWGKNI